MKAFNNIFEQIEVIKAKEKAIQQQNIDSLKKAAEEIKALLKSQKK